MDLTTLETILIAVAPAFAAITTIVGGLISMYRQIKKIKSESDKIVIESNEKLKKAYNDIAVIKAKLTSIEKNITKKE